MRFVAMDEVLVAQFGNETLLRRRGTILRPCRLLRIATSSL
jgi:hypothetical protein